MLVTAKASEDLDVEIQFLKRTMENAKRSLQLEDTFAGFGVLRIPVLVEEWVNDLVPVVDLVQRRVTSLNEFQERPTAFCQHPGWFVELRLRLTDELQEEDGKKL
mmetsp:Transcript_14296/g.22287  ORF Transcript_14296/g.22287 Transcript_14296/m.22287 type:complete len:105 (-) Transcript_14296:470-784(-)